MQGRRLIGYVVLSTMVLIPGCGAGGGIEPPEEFMQAQIITPYGMNNQPFGEYTVAQFVEMVNKVQMTNGEYLRAGGWSKEDNVYMLPVETNDGVLTLVFVHLLADNQGAGIYTSLTGARHEEDGSTVGGIAVMRMVVHGQ